MIGFFKKDFMILLLIFHWEQKMISLKNICSP